VLLTTQYLEEADALANEITVIDHGRVIAHDTPQGLKRQVGGQTLEVRPTSIDDLEAIRMLLLTVGTREPEQPAPDQLSVPVSGETALTTVVAALAAQKISVSELSLRLPSLDEVFYSLTGRKNDVEVAA
jgi:oleandomycin transport system ATP-binding protein